MTRLTNDIRDAILRSLIKHRFQPEIDAIEDRVQALAGEVYDAAYDAETQARMQDLPDGRLFQDDDFEAHFGGQRVRIGFNVYMYRGADMAGLDNARPKVLRRLLEQHRGRSLVSLTTDHPLSKKFEAINQDRERLKEAIGASRRLSSAPPRAMHLASNGTTPAPKIRLCMKPKTTNPETARRKENDDCART